MQAEAGDLAAAREAVTAVLRIDDRFAEAWAIRGELAYAASDLAGAIGDLDRAVECRDTPGVRFNRAVAYEEAGDYARAIADYNAVLAMSDDADARRRRDTCRRIAAEQVQGL